MNLSNCKWQKSKLKRKVKRMIPKTLIYPHTQTEMREKREGRN